SLFSESRMADATWHRLGTKDELAGRAPFAIKLDRYEIAVFLHESRIRAISNTCNHKGGPLCEGQVHGEFVMCPWHGWEYSLLTGKGPEGYGEDAAAVFAVDERSDGVYLQTPPTTPRKVIKHEPHPLSREVARPAGA